jgi:hypothetical protein
MVFIPDADEWLQRRLRNYNSPWGEWTIIGGQMLIWPVLAAGVTASFVYIDKNCVTLASGGSGDSFLADGDSYALDERLLKLGMIWQWKALKGTSYTEDMGTYADALTTAMGKDSPSPILVDRLPSSRTASLSYPWPVPT